MTDKPDPVCGDCIGFLPATRGVGGEVRGRCGVRPELGEIPETLRYCASFRVRSERAGAVRMPTNRTVGGPRTPRTRAPGTVSRRRPTLDNPTTGDTGGEITMDRDGLKQVLRELLEEETLYGYPELGARWQDGTLVLKPASSENQPKEIPLEGFFHKIVMLRDRLRVLEAKLNGHDKLSDADKVELQTYISRCYGTLTTFNVLFADKEDQFSSKGE
ncbi:MAG: hypothetical protein ABIJ09_14270 [Pseudomonadota bacterium]